MKWENYSPCVCSKKLTDGDSWSFKRLQLLQVSLVLSKVKYDIRSKRVFNPLGKVVSLLCSVSLEEKSSGLELRADEMCWQKGKEEVGLERNWEIGKVDGCVGQLDMRAGEGAGVSLEDEGGTYEQDLRLRPSGWQGMRSPGWWGAAAPEWVDWDGLATKTGLRSLRSRCSWGLGECGKC